MKKKKIKPCLTKQLLNMFKLWCEWGISLTMCEVNKTSYNPSICKLLHLILTQAFKESKLISEKC